MTNKFVTKAAITRLLQEISLDVCVHRGVIEVGLSNDVSQILKRPTLVAMATKFESKQAITPLVYKNIAVSLAPSRGICRWAIE